MRAIDQVFTLFIVITFFYLSDASGLRNKKSKKRQEGSNNLIAPILSTLSLKDRITETFGGVTMTTNEDGTEPPSEYYLFQINEDNGVGSSMCASLRKFGVGKEDCTYLENVQVGYFKPPKGKKSVIDALSDGDLRLYIDSIESDQEAQAIGVSSPPETWGLDYTDGTYPDSQYEYADVDDASDVVIAIIDTGIYFDHEQFSDVHRYPGKSFVIEDQNFLTDPQGHGTHCAGTAVGRTVGVGVGLRNVQLTAVKVLGANGSGSFAGVIGGINWVAGEADKNPDKQYVANMSLGGGFSSTMNEAVNNLANRPNVEVVVAAGNDGRDACSYSPASAANAITVGSMTISETRSSFSNYGSCVDVYAPGSGIKSSYNTGTSSYAVLSGTSMAAPHVAGAVAITKAKNMNVEDIFKPNCIRANPNVCLSTCSTIPGADCSNEEGGGDGGEVVCKVIGERCSSDTECCSDRCTGFLLSPSTCSDP